MTDLAALIRALRRAGYTVSRTRRGHWRVTRDGQTIAVTPSTPSDWRSLANVRADIRRHETTGRTRRTPATRRTD